MPPHRLALISDVHANLPALEAVLAELEKESISRIIHAGDVVDYSPFPNEVIALFQKHDIKSIQGNHDRAALDWDTTRWNQYAVYTSNWSRQNLSESSLHYLEGLKKSKRLKVTGIQIAVHHGSPFDPDKYIREEIADSSLLEKAKARILVLGHTHKPFVANLKEGTIVNPGSVGQPRDGNWKASYAILAIDDDGEYDIQLRRVEYDLKKAQAACRKADFPDKLAEWLETGCG